MMSVPVMSDGIRSGVNWMRLNFRSSTRASVWISSVLASPGTPTMRLLPPTKSVSRTSLTTSSWPMMSFRSSVMIRSRPAFIRSASATSSGDSRSMVSVTAEFKTASSAGGNGWARPHPGRQPIHHVVDPELVRVVREIDRRDAGIGKLPVLTDVVVHVRDGEHPLRGIVVHEQAPVARTELPAVNGRRRERLRVRDLEKRVEHFRRSIELYPARLGQDHTHLV